MVKEGGSLKHFSLVTLKTLVPMVLIFLKVGCRTLFARHREPLCLHYGGRQTARHLGKVFHSETSSKQVCAFYASFVGDCTSRDSLEFLLFFFVHI